MSFVNENNDTYRANIYLTRRCDVRCWYCRVPLINAVQSQELSVAQWFTVIDRLKEMNATLVINTGGEVFLRQDALREVVAYEIAQGLYPIVLTNGRLLHESARARETLRYLVGQGLNALSVSIDTITDDFASDEGSTTKSAAGRWALEYAASLGMTNLSFTAVIDDTQPQRIFDLLKWNANRFSVIPQVVVRDIRGTFSGAAQLELTDQQQADLRGTIYSLIKHGEELGVVSSTPYFEGILSGEYRKFVCWLPGHIVVDPTGRVQLCQDIAGSHLFEGLNLSTTEYRGSALRDHYDQLWQQDLTEHCPGCYMRCHVDYHVRRSGGIRVHHP